MATRGHIRVNGVSVRGRIRRSVAVIHLDCALERNHQGLAFTVAGFSGGNFDPTLADAVFLHVMPVLAVKPDADVMFENGSYMMFALRVSG